GYSDIERRFQNFFEARELVEISRERGEHYLSFEAIVLALELMPYDSGMLAYLEENPVNLEAQIREGMAKLREENPEQENWRYYLRVEPGFARLDLNGNTNLHFVEGLEGLPLNELDLSGTKVRDISSLRGMPLRVLRIDNTLVTSLEPVEGSPLEIISFEATAVEAFQTGDPLKNIPCRRGKVAARSVNRWAGPVSGASWENELGMRFEPIGDGTKFLSVWETRVKDFEVYARDAGLALPAPMMTLEDGQWANRGNTWRKPDFKSSPEHPVVGVSWTDARQFCEWLTERGRESGVLERGQRYRLPTDLEWSQAAGVIDSPLLSARMRSLGSEAGESRIEAPLPVEIWEEGEAPELAELVEGEAGASGEHHQPAEQPWIGKVGRSGPWRGVADLGGNAREWCLDSYDSEQQRYFVRGGGVAERLVTIHKRAAVARNERYSDIGFRVLLETVAPVLEQSLADLAAGNRWDEARLVALSQAIAEDHPDLRDAGRDYVVFQNFVRKRDQSVPRSALDLRQFDGRYYYFTDIPMNWKQGEKLCEAVGGHLATITSQEEMDWIVNELQQHKQPRSVWLGAAMARRRGGWEWLTGESWGFWPNIPGVGRAGSDQLVMFPSGMEVAVAGLEREAGADVGHEFEDQQAVPVDGSATTWAVDDAAETHHLIIEWESVEDVLPLRPSAPPEVAAGDGK
ncbi:MAG: SUMF1/EgtB/PvdO family nonheme iron enzyme, partial [Verrucomicrobiales bacterium]